MIAVVDLLNNPVSRSFQLCYLDIAYYECRVINHCSENHIWCVILE